VVRAGVNELMKSNADILSTLAKAVGMVSLDVGARRGIGNDLDLLGSGVHHFGLEPDLEECGILNADPDKPSNVSYLPLALSDGEESFVLNLYSQRGCSSKLTARKEHGDKFSRGGYYIHEGQVSVPAMKLDDAVSENKIPPPSFMKIDVQGMEAEVFRGASSALSGSIVGIRTEVSFVQLYEGQPLFAEIDQLLRPYGFVPMRWIELHEWRRSTKLKYPRLSEGQIPYSRGQMIHGDVLYLLDPETLPCESEEEIKRMVWLALVSICYGHFDHAEVVLKNSVVREYCNSLVGEDVLVAMQGCSQSLARKFKIERLLSRLSFGFMCSRPL